jgi:hypothetical protein
MSGRVRRLVTREANTPLDSSSEHTQRWPASRALFRDEQQASLMLLPPPALPAADAAMHGTRSTSWKLQLGKTTTWALAVAEIATSTPTSSRWRVAATACGNLLVKVNILHLLRRLDPVQ